VTAPRRLAPSDLGRLSFGGAPIGGLYEEVTDDDARAAVTAAVDRGVRYFDTAPLYGHGLSERRLGSVLGNREREAFVVSTKAGRLLRPDGTPQDFWKGAPPEGPVFDFSSDGIRRSLDESLERLGLDGVDIAYVHDPDDHWEQARHEAYPALLQLREQGVVRAIGVGMNQCEMPVRFVRETDIDIVLLAGRYTLLDRSGSRELLPLCEERGVTVVAGGVFNSGVLAGGSTYDYQPAPREIRQQVTDLEKACARFGVPLAAAAIQFPLRHPAVATVLVGARTAREVEENARLMEVEIPDALWEELA